MSPTTVLGIQAVTLVLQVITLGVMLATYYR